MQQAVEMGEDGPGLVRDNGYLIILGRRSVLPLLPKLKPPRTGCRILLPAPKLPTSLRVNRSPERTVAPARP